MPRVPEPAQLPPVELMVCDPGAVSAGIVTVMAYVPWSVTVPVPSA